MKRGDVVRLRTLRTYHPDGVGWYEFKPDDGTRAKDLKRCFVAVVLGTEGLQLVKDGEQVMASLDMDQAMNDLGWYSGAQLKEAKVSKRALKKLGVA